MTFGEIVQELRKKKNLSQTELGEKVGVSMRTVRGWEVESRFPKQREIYTRLAEVLECNINYLMDDNAAFITDAAEKYGYSGTKQAEKIVSDFGNFLAAGGEISESDKDAVMQTLQELYWKAKKENVEKYTPKKYRKGNKS